MSQSHCKRLVEHAKYITCGSPKSMNEIELLNLKNKKRLALTSYINHAKQLE